MVILIVSYYFNQIVLIILDPLIKVNFEYNNQYLLLSEIHNISDINLSFYNELIIKQFNKSSIVEANNKFNYIPCFEINLNINNTSNLYIIIIILYSIYYYIPYIIYLFIRNIYYLNYTFIFKLISIVLISNIISIKLLIPSIYKITLHNYQEYLYFEFDIGFDFYQFVFLYFKIIYLFSFINIASLILLLNYKKTKINILLYNLIICLYLFKVDLIIIIIFSTYILLLIILLKIYKIINKINIEYKINK